MKLSYCFDDCDQHRSNSKVRLDPLESFWNKISNEYSYSPRGLWTRELWSVYSDHVWLEHSRTWTEPKASFLLFLDLYYLDNMSDMETMSCLINELDDLVLNHQDCSSISLH